VIGVESYEPPIHDARSNAIEAGIYNVEFIRDLCERAVVRIDEPIDVIVLDPPRSGCKKELIQACSRISPREIVYVSCNPATLPRDLALFGQFGYRPLLIQPIDIFPRTYHVETVVWMSRVKD
jgi:23S rRNA (uracil1939-C5)-methyltransferase